jgi:asparagine synthase (glutamine-hydrolysing)
MCGIAGVISKGGVNRDDVMSMTVSLAHRGPDAHGIFINRDNTVGLGHTRLSVIDLTDAANQPFSSIDGRYTIVYNGEIYNYKSLRRELQSLAPQIQWRTQSDTEVVLNGFIRWGVSVSSKLEGMFAFAVYDQKEDQLFLCRDRIGKKPLYYFHQEGLFAFASELKALLQVPAISSNRVVNYDAIYTFLHLGYIPQSETAYESIRKFPAAHYAYYSHADLNTTPYSDIAGIQKHRGSNALDYKDQIRSSLTNAVGKRLIADVPVGAFLSGGTDSSLVVAIASQLRDTSPLKTFSIGFKESEFDETIYARKVANILRCDHSEHILLEEEAVHILEQYVSHFDEPFADTSAIPMMLVSKHARDAVKVVLTGDGGDELFLGYGAYKWANRLDMFSANFARAAVAQGLKLFGNSRLKRVGFLLEPTTRSEVRSHIFSQEQYYFTRREIVKMAQKDRPRFGSLKYDDPLMPALTPAEKQALFDISFYLRDDLLVKVDRASMFYGLECRCPFLDSEVVSQALSLPYNIKRPGREGKLILKRILKDYLPDELVYRRKCGFSVPLARWMRNELRYLLDRYLNESIVSDIGIVKYANVHALKASFFRGEDFLYHRLWVLLITHKWLSENARSH